VEKSVENPDRKIEKSRQSGVFSGLHTFWSFWRNPCGCRELPRSSFARDAWKGEILQRVEEFQQALRRNPAGTML
jgi:hypothetical protein